MHLVKHGKQGILASLALATLISCGGGGGGSGGGFTFTDGEGAATVIGQADFTSSGSNGGGVAAANTLYNAYGVGTIYEGRLYLPDPGNNRILIFNSVPKTNGAPADAVWGQPDFATTAAGDTSDGSIADRLHQPTGVVFSNGHMFIRDLGNNRVLIFNTIPAPTTGYLKPDVVLGATDNYQGSHACTQSTFWGEEFSVTGDKIIVADAWNHRVLIWNSIPSTNGAPADVVLGQANFTSCMHNRGGAVAADTLGDPFGTWSDGTRLFVAEWSNSRVTVWNTFPTTNGQPADMVLGQTSLTATNSGTDRTVFATPYGLTSNGTKLFMADCFNSRVLVWDALPTTDNAAPDHVIGQPNFTSSDSNATRQGMNCPAGLTATADTLVVTDSGNNRALIFH